MAAEALGDRRITRGLAGAVGRERVDRVVLGVGGRLRAVEDIVGRKMDERRADLAAGVGERGRSVAIDGEGDLALCFGLIDRGIGAGVDDDARPHRDDRRLHVGGMAEIELFAIEEIGGKTRGPDSATQLMPDLTDPADDEDFAAHRLIVLHAAYFCINSKVERRFSVPTRPIDDIEERLAGAQPADVFDDVAGGDLWHRDRGDVRQDEDLLHAPERVFGW